MYRYHTHFQNNHKSFLNVRKAYLFISFRLIRQRKNVDHAEIDSSPESYRNVSKPFGRVKHFNLGYTNSKERKFRDIDSKDASKTPPFSVDNDLDLMRCNYYLRRQTPTYKGIDKKWILVESQHIL